MINLSPEYRVLFGVCALSLVFGANARAADKAEEEEEGEEEADVAEGTGDVTAAPDHDPAWVVPTDQLIPAVPQRVPAYGYREDWSILPYGYTRLDVIEDSTQSFEGGIGSTLIQRVGTYKGSHRRNAITARDTRIGLQIGAPSFPDITPMRKGIRTSAQIEFDFFGLAPTDAKKNDTVIFGPLRLRLGYVRVDTWLVDVIAGQYYDLFGWGGYYYPGTVAYLGVPGLIYHRNPQLRIERKFKSDGGDVEFMMAVAGVAGAHRDSGIPDVQGGLRLSYKGWKSVASSGFGIANLVPLSIGVSGTYRFFEMPAFRLQPGLEHVKTHGYGVAASLLLPVIPADALYSRGNALTITGEFSIGTGTADMYTGMDGGSRFPLLPDPTQSKPAPAYQANVDPGLVTFDRALQPKTVNWQAFVAGLQYFLPIGDGRVAISGIYSRVWSNNIKMLTPQASWGGIFTKMEYIDANIRIEITPAVILGLSGQTVVQTFGDVSAPTPESGVVAGDTPGIPTVPGRPGGVSAKARNNRAQLSMSFFF